MTIDLREQILDAVSADAKARMADDFPFRHHLGASLLGHSCDRYLFFTFRWVQEPSYSSRTLRIFERGRSEETRIIDKLKAIGLVIDTVNPDDPEAQIRAQGLPAHLGGSMDGVLHTPATHVQQYGYYMPLEIKTHNDKSFGKTFGKHLLNVSNPQHYTQGNIYGSAMQSSHFLYVGMNKNTDELDLQFCPVDDVSAKIFIQRGVNIVYSTVVTNLPRTDEKWRCKMCDFKDICHSSKPAPARSCRSCKHYSPQPDGSWLCTKRFMTIAKYNEIDYANEQCDLWASII